MINRTLAVQVLQIAKKFPVIALTGPRQSGKTTLAKKLFPKKPYVSLENPDVLELAKEDPRRFLSHYPQGAVFDEVQKAPLLFSYLQGIVDESKKAGQFILTGSQNFNLLQAISQSLAGRVALLTLLPFSYQELRKSKYAPKSLEESMFKGFYPRLYDASLAPGDWFPNYIQTYIERDVRLVTNVKDLSLFQRFVRLCAARTGQILNYNDLANDVGISTNTIKAWISILEASYIVFRLNPYYKNFSKRLIKAPKLYFWDTGLVCYLLNIHKQSDLVMHSTRGQIFETWIVSEMMKQDFNSGKMPAYFYWRDKRHEIDLIHESSAGLTPIEIKSAKTAAAALFDSLKYWCALAKVPQEKSFLIYAGDECQQRSLGKLCNWKDLPKFS